MRAAANTEPTSGNTLFLPGWDLGGPIFYACSAQEPGTIPIYRFYDSANNRYMLSRDNSPPSPWQLQGRAFYAYPDTSAPGTIEIHQFYQDQGGGVRVYVYGPESPWPGWTADGTLFNAYPVAT